MAVFKRQALDKMDQRKAHAGRHKVLLVDDKESNRLVMAAVLKPHFDLIEADDGESAVSLIRGLDEPDQLACIVSDYRMPNLNGVGLFEQARTLVPHASRIIVTGYIDIDALIDSINRAHIDHFIVKPFDAADFLTTVKEAVARFDSHQRHAAYVAELEAIAARHAPTAPGAP
jgi:response regulator RpfG family c-di-GMP phosphodiesterase